MLSRILGGIGRAFITVGALILLFVVYQLWGTGLQTAQSQKELGNEFEQILAEAKTTTTTAPGNPLENEPAADEPEVVPGILPKEGDPIAEIKIPSIGVDRTVVSGISLDQLKRGPGHYPESPLPGQEGNVAIAGHRTTYGQPFHNVDKIKPGDEIIFETQQGTFTYEATETIIVRESQVEVLQDQGDNRVTLIACHPKYSAAQRIVVIGKLKDEPVPPIEGQAEAREEAAKVNQVSIDEGASSTPAPKGPAIIWGLIAAGIWFVTWLGQRFLRRRVAAEAAAEGTTPTRGQRLLTWSPYLVGVPVFLVALYVFFENFGRLLPGNY